MRPEFSDCALTQCGMLPQICQSSQQWHGSADLVLGVQGGCTMDAGKPSGMHSWAPTGAGQSGVDVCTLTVPISTVLA